MQQQLFNVLEELKELDNRIEKSLVVDVAPSSPPHNPVPHDYEQTSQQKRETAQLIVASPPRRNQRDTAQLIVASPPRRNHKQRRCERRAAKKRQMKANRSPEQKVAAAEEMLNNISRQAATLTRQKVRSSQRRAKLAYKDARKRTAENEALKEDAVLAATFQGCGYSAKLTTQQIKQATIARTIPTAVVDSGASTTCAKPEEEEMQESECGGYKWSAPAHCKTGNKSNKIFAMALGHTARGGDIVTLPLNVRGKANEGHTVSGIKNNLYSLNGLVREGYIPIFDSEGFKVYDATNTKIWVTRGAVLRGYYCPNEGLWRIPLLTGENQTSGTAKFKQSPTNILRDAPPPPTQHINNVYELRAQPQLIRYYHAAAGFPTQRTWIKAIANGHYQSWAGLTEAAVRRNFPESRETMKGHGRKIKMNVRSTKTLVKEEEEKAVASADDSQTSACYHAIYNLQSEMDRKMYTDQTGKFPVTSYKGKQYVMVLHETSSNAILVEGLTNRTSGEMVATYQSLVDRLRDSKIEPKMHILDNEISQEFKNAIKANQMKFQLVPPNDHRRNIAEKAIQVFKDHFIAVLCGTDVSFPMQLWCQILRQAEHQLNLLRKSRVDPSKSAFEILHGKHDYNAHPFAPLGSAVELHVMPSKRKTWGEHTKSGFYLGTAWEHYRCHVVWGKDTRYTDNKGGPNSFFQA